MLAFRAWFYLKHRDLISDSTLKETLGAISAHLDIDDRGTFLKAVEVLDQQKYK